MYPMETSKQNPPLLNYYLELAGAVVIDSVEPVEG